MSRKKLIEVALPLEGARAAGGRGSVAHSDNCWMENRRFPDRPKTNSVIDLFARLRIFVKSAYARPRLSRVGNSCAVVRIVGAFCAGFGALVVRRASENTQAFSRDPGRFPEC